MKKIISGQKIFFQKYAKLQKSQFSKKYVFVIIKFLSSRDIQLTSTITVPEGMLVIGGWNQESGSLRENPNSGGFYKQVYLLSDNVWSLVGNLNEPVSDATVIRVGEWINTVAGDSANNNVERFKWNGQEVENVETISKHENTILRPIAFQSYKNFCTFQN